MNTDEFNGIKENYLNAEKEYYLTKSKIMAMYPQYATELELIPDECWYEKTDDGRVIVHANMGFSIQIFDSELAENPNFRLNVKVLINDSLNFLEERIASILIV